jgi:hypothetical protein
MTFHPRSVTTVAEKSRSRGKFAHDCLGINLVPMRSVSPLSSLGHHVLCDSATMFGMVPIAPAKETPWS